MPFTPGVASIVLLRSALQAIGYSYEELMLGGKKFTIFKSPDGKVWCTANQAINYPFPSNTARAINISKAMAYDLAGRLGVNYPKTIQVVQLSADTPGLDELLAAGPVIVKPNDSSLARGLTLDVTNFAELGKGIDYARQYSDSALVQQQVRGEELRFAVLNGKVEAVLLRRTARVTGDSGRNLGQLIADENAVRADFDLPHGQYPALDQTILDLSKFDMSLVPHNGETVELGSSAMVRYGASIYNVFDEVDSSYNETVETMAAPLGDGFVVVDMFVEDYTRPRTTDNYNFLEFNMIPLLVLFYSCRDGRNFDIASRLAEMVDASLHAQMGAVS